MDQQNRFDKFKDFNFRLNHNEDGNNDNGLIQIGSSKRARRRRRWKANKFITRYRDQRKSHSNERLAEPTVLQTFGDVCEAKKPTLTVKNIEEMTAVNLINNASALKVELSVLPEAEILSLPPSPDSDVICLSPEREILDLDEIDTNPTEFSINITTVTSATQTDAAIAAELENDQLANTANNQNTTKTTTVGENEKEAEKDAENEAEAEADAELENAELLPNTTSNKKKRKRSSDVSCRICDFEGHTSHQCQMICKNCNAKYHNMRSCPKPSQTRKTLANFLDFCVEQFIDQQNTSST